MNEPELARIYHDRMLIGFDEKNWSNASIRVRDALAFERKLFQEYFL